MYLFKCRLQSELVANQTELMSYSGSTVYLHSATIGTVKLYDEF